ncbi:pVII [Fowl aviadenovirus B]|uniref:PVII n=2 Tax=Fowl aviadenovirus B TaxID=190062 RepID=A0A896IJK4_9ADEN|nr:pVII [Fowl aviadenovirus B]QSC42522.1 pVII [Fowl aviadenovirus 5]UNG39724.1 pVII [Fowl aviadenovirus B]UNG39760.1 pVII [Fowl aviadenovirus B]UNG39796.1 pVII [Fowl aviadenovirus B]
MSILVSPNDNRGWGMRRRSRSAMRGVGTRRRPRRSRMTLRTLLGLGTASRRRRGRRVGRRSRPAATSSRLVVVRTSRRSRRR